MAEHKFQVGQIVRLRSPGAAGPGTVFEVRQKLPAGPDGEVVYRIKALHEAHERMAKESELLPATAPQPGRR
jgi:hypothetical protein